MGYDFHITRAENWANSDENPISAEEWLELIREDPELMPSPKNGEYFVIWRGTTVYPEAWFNWQDGNIYTKNPEKATLWKLYQMAQRLNAKLQGDEDEIWGFQDIEAFVDHVAENKAVILPAKKTDNGILARIKHILKKS